MSDNKTTTKCDRGKGNCPPKYKNIGSERFGDERRVTSEMLFQFCQNDSYLYKQVKELWDKTDPEHRKRFYPPYYMDSSKSYGIEPINIEDNWFDANDSDKFGNMTDAYYLSNCSYEQYNADFNYTNDTTYHDANPNATVDTVVINNDNIIEDNSTLHIVAQDIGVDEDSQNIKYTVLPIPISKDVSAEIPFKTYTTQKVTTNTTAPTKKKVVTKTDVYGKLTLDANCSGPYKDWKANSVWYIGYNRHKNYNVKNAWRKNSDTYDIPSVCRGQTFKAENTGELRKVSFLMKGSSKSVSPCIVEIRTTKNRKPTQKVLARTEQKFNHSSKAMVNFTFKKPCKVEKGKRYAIVLRSPLSNFNHCYWIGGWASTCFSNSRKRAYYGGDTYLSEDNGKTWTLHGTKEKCYGSHYYDWGFAEAPVNFGFEVYIAPKSGTKSVTSYVPQNKSGQTVETVTHEYTDHYTACAKLNYYEKGDYYLEFKPFAGNFYTSITCVYDIQESNDSELNHGNYTWEIFNMDTGEWESFNDYTYKQGNISNTIINGETNFKINFTHALTFVKVRLKLSLNGNILCDTENGLSDISTNLEEIATKSGVQGNDVTNWVNSVYDEFLWADNDHTPLTLRQLKSVHFVLGKKPSFKGYLRTLEYHPVQEGMLPACIWAEIDADGVAKGNGECKIDIVHEKTAIDRILLYKADNLELRPYIIDYRLNVLKDALEDSLANDYLTQEQIKNYIIEPNFSYNEEFIKYLQEQTPKVYILPYQQTENGVTEWIYLFGDEDIAPIVMDDYLAYPVNSCSIGTQDHHLNLKDTIESNGFVKENANFISYTFDEDLTDKVKSVSIIYHHPNPSDEGDIEVEVLDLEQNSDYEISGNKITFNINKAYDNQNSSDPILKQFITLSSGISLKSNNMIDENATELLVEMVSTDYNEFQHYIVDYDNKTFNFYHPLQLMEGELKVNYNPLWCRNLEITDFPLRMDLWTEYWHIVNSNGKMLFGHCKINECGKVEVSSDMVYDDEITTKVAPLDNIRQLEVQDFEGNTMFEMEEDIDYFVDYLTNKINFVVPSQKKDGIVNKDLKDWEGYVIMIKYTPNLTDNGLSIAYRVSRPIYDGTKLISETNLLDLSSHVETSTDNYYLFSNYFTTRT